MATKGNGGSEGAEHDKRGKGLTMGEEDERVETRGRRRTKSGERKKQERISRSRSKNGSKARTTSRTGSKDKAVTPTKDNDVKEKVSTEEDPKGIMSTASTIAMSLMGMATKEQRRIMTVKVKKERAEDDEKYSGAKRTDVQSETKTTRTPTRMVMIDMTTPTSSKRKNEEIKRNTGTSGNEKKKKKQQQLIITPKRVTMERESESGKKGKQEDNKNKKEASHENKKKEPDEGKNGTKEKMNNTPTNTECTPKKGDKPKEIANERRETKRDYKNKQSPKIPPEISRITKENDTPKETTTQQKKMGIPNPYKLTPVKDKEAKTNEDETEAPTPTSTNGRKMTYATATEGGQTKLKTHEKKRGKQNHRFEVSFTIEEEEKQKPECELSNLRETITAIFKRAKKVDKNSMINTWQDGSRMRTIEKIEDIPFTPNDMKMYLNHPYRDRKFQRKNNNWRINLSFSIPHDLFLHYWEMSKREFKEVKFVTLREASTQSERSYNCGTFINSSDGQIIEHLNKKLNEELATKVNLAYRPAPLDKKTADEFWKNAYEQAKNGRGNLFKHAPMALNVYAETAEDARKTAKKLLEKYGRQIEGQYPRMPDGSRMRFVPASRFLDMAGQDTAKSLFANQIKFNTNQVKIPLPITNLDKTFEQHEGKNTMELLLDMKCESREHEPYFRHVTKMWTKNFKDKRYTVSVHKEMAQEATKIIANLHEELKDRYGEEVAMLASTQDEEEEIHIMTGGSTHYSMSTMTLDTNDRYLNGSARFIIEGMEALNTNERDNTLAAQRANEEDNYTMEIASKGTNESKETIATMKDRSKGPTIVTNISQETKEQNKDQTKHPISRDEEKGEEDWKRVGDKIAETRLRRAVTNTTNHDPGGPTGGNQF